jgi:DNA primase
MIPAPVIEEIRARVDPVAVIGKRVELRRTGSSFSARCPFHADRTPSFRVFPDSRRFKCFGCGARGDAFEFLQRFERKDFRTVVRELAAEAGVVLEEDAAERRIDSSSGATAVARACEAAHAHWTRLLWAADGDAARKYLAARGVEEATARRFGLGYALPAWHDLHAALVSLGFAEEDLVRAGLAREGKALGDLAHDRFRGRVIFPFFDGTGRVVGFAGRILPQLETDSRVPKYLNGPETELFKKGQLLFGLGQSAPFIHRTRRAVVVEGYLDALALAQAGIQEVVAVGGTAIGEHQVSLLHRAGAEELILLLDTDEPGLEAPARVAPVLLRAEPSTRVARLPGSTAQDPDTFLHARGLRALRDALECSVPLTEWLLERAIAARCPRGPGKAISVEQKLLIVRDLKPFVAATRAGLPRALFEQRIARRLELYIVALRAELARGAGQRGGGTPWPR